MIVWALISSTVQPIIPRRMGKQNESTKSLKICSVLVFWAMVRNGPASPTHWVLIQQQLSRKHQDVTFWSTLWMTLPHTVKLVRDKQIGYIWSRHRDRGRRESKTNSCKHPDRPILSENLHWQKVSSLGVWSRGSHIPSSLPNEWCMSLRHLRQAGSPLYQYVSHHRQVWADVISSGATVKAVRRT
jgi:hypothetical protein